MALNTSNTVLGVNPNEPPLMTLTFQDDATVRASARFHRTVIATDAGVTAAAQALAQLSNAALIGASESQRWVVGNGIAQNLVYPDCSNKLVLQFRHSTGLRYQIQVPAPEVALFNPDLVTGITGSASVIQGVVNSLCDDGSSAHNPCISYADGTPIPASDFTRAFRINRKGGRVTGIRSRE